MEETKIEAMKTSSDKLDFFPPHRRRPLKSETYRTLVRIFSQCYDDSDFSLDRELDTENGGNEFLGRRTENQVARHVKLVGIDSTEAKNLNVNEQMAINEIEQLMRVEENEDFLNQKDVIGFQNLGSGPEQMLIDELEHIVKGNKDIVHENNLNPPQIPMVGKQIEISEVELLENKEEHVEIQEIGVKNSVSASQKLSFVDDVGIDGSAGGPGENDEVKCSLLSTEVMELNSVSVADSSSSSIPVNKFGETEKGKNHAQKRSEDSNLSLEKYTVIDALDSRDNNDDQLSAKPNALEADNEISVKDRELEKPVCSGGIVGSADQMTEDVEMEDGEISGDYSIDDISMDTLLQDAEMLEDKRVSEEPLNRCINDKREFSFAEANERDPGSTFFARYTVDNNNTRAVGLGGNDRNKSAYTPDIVVPKETLGAGKLDANDSMLEARKIEKKGTGGNNMVLHEQILENDMTRHNSITTEKEGSEVKRKKKRGPSTKEKKAKKKQKDRKKRAEKNRQLGVKRLKLPPISKPKTVSYCRHYLNGRCHEGENCKFSHDIVPLTKSKPCCYFARHQCMKGDDCPFDHQLSKYPCSNFVSRGFCSKGDNCMFSHKIVPKEDGITVSKATETEMKLASGMGNSTSKKEKKRDGASQHTSSVLSYTKQMHSHKNPEKNVQETVSKQSEVVAKGTSFLSIGTSSLVDSGKLKQQMLSPNNENHNKQRGLGAVENSSEISNRTPPVVAPKGINFLAFGVQRDDLSSRKLANTSSSGDNGVKLSPLDNSNTPNQTSSAPYSNPMLKGIQPALTPKGISFLSFGKVSTDDSCSEGKSKLPPNSDNGTDSCVKGKQSQLDLLQRSSTTSSPWQCPPILLVQSSNSSVSRIYKDTPHSAQKALMSTLAFAAKCESRMKLNQSSRDLSVATKNDKEARNKGIMGGSKDDLAKASNILEFLSSIGSKSKQ